MNRWLTSNRLFVLICMVLLISSLLPARWAGMVAALPHNLVTLVTSPVTYQLKTFSDRIRPVAADDPLVDGQQDWRVWYEKFQRQKQYSQQLAEALRQARKQLSTFERLLSMVGEADVKFLNARVAAYHHSGPKKSLTIDRGESDGVESGQAVVDGENLNLVGRVEQAGWRTSTVRLITSAETHLKVRLLPPDVGVSVEGTPQWIRMSDDGQTFQFQVPFNAAVAQGDMAHLADDRWPGFAQGFIVGQVSEVKPDPSNPKLYQIVVIDPMPAMAALNDVTVLVPFDEAEEPSR